MRTPILTYDIQALFQLKPVEVSSIAVGIVFTAWAGYAYPHHELRNFSFGESANITAERNIPGHSVLLLRDEGEGGARFLNTQEVVFHAASTSDTTAPFEGKAYPPSLP